MVKPFSKKATFGDKYRSAMKITDPKEAKEYFEACVQHTMLFGKSREEAEKTERDNIGYFAGYYDSETAKRVNLLFGAVHPIFGSVEPTPEEAFKAGQKLAEKESKV